MESPAQLGRVKTSRARSSLVGSRALVRQLLEQRGRADRALVAVLGLLVGLACVFDVPELRLFMPTGIDIEIPLRAASHWAAGSPVYPPSAMLVQSGPDLPFLYPPYSLPFLAPLAALPRDMVTGLWLGLGLLVAVWTCRRLAIPWLAVPFVLAWPPFAEGLITGNIQILCFAAFVAIFYEPVGGLPGQRSFMPSRDAVNGLGTMAVGALKVTQALPLVYLARRRFRAAAIGVAALAVVALATLPLTGLAVYGDWLTQLGRAADPAWTIGGDLLGRSLGVPDLAFAAAGGVLALLLRGRDSAAWLGIAMVIATPGVHGFTFLFLLPGLLAIRRDLAIPIAALFIGVYHVEHWWLAAALVAVILVAMPRWPWLRVEGPEMEPAAT